MTEEWDDMTTTGVGIGAPNPVDVVDITGGLRISAKAFTAPTDGVGLELSYRTASDAAFITLYSRASSVYKDLTISGLALHFASGSGGVEQMLIASSGNISIATGSLTVSDIYSRVVTTRAVNVDSTGLLGTASSSARYKKNISALEIPSDKIYDLRPISFTYRHNDERTFGLIAEDVIKILPEIVEFDKLGRPDYVAYERLPATSCRNSKTKSKSNRIAETSRKP